MAGFNFQPPPGPQMMPFNPQMALQAFRPPPPMNMGSMGMPGMGGMMPQSGGGGPSPQQGAGMLSNAMSGFKGFGSTPDGLPTSGLGGMTGNAAQNASLMNLAPGNASFGDLGGTGFQPAFDFLGGGSGAFAGAGQAGSAGLDAFFSGAGMLA